MLNENRAASPRPSVSPSPRPRVSPSPRPRVSASPRLLLLLSAFCLMFSSGCRQDMQDQPRMKPFRSTTFFSNGLSSRPPVTGTVPRGFLRADKAFFTGKKDTATGTSAVPAASPAPNGQQPTYPDDIEEFPLTITPETVSRGRERYEIFCSACHGFTGNGDGMIVRRGFRRAASFHTDALRQAPVGHYFDAITNGWGAMPSYAPQIPPGDRWAIIAYIRALQVSNQNVQSQPASPGAPAGPTPVATPASGGH
jgi:mono/diheme cytochrome c family protein